MKHLLLTTALAFTLAAPAYADAGHGAEDTVEGTEMRSGKPGRGMNVTRTIDVSMQEVDGGMRFEPAAIDIVKGETIQFNVTNSGYLEHEFVIGTFEGNAEHKIAMAQSDMEHDDPNSIRLDEGGSGEIIWEFSNTGSFEFACLISGHYESGMHGPITVSEEVAEVDLVYTVGEIKKINASGGKVTIIHGPLINLDMPAMTMVFRADEEIISRLSEGQNVEFIAERVNGKLTIAALK